MTLKFKRGREISESRALVHHAFGLAQSLGISTILVQVEEPGDFRAIENVRESENVLWLVRDPELRFELRRGDAHIVIPDTGLTRFSQLNIALFRAVVEERIALDESVVCLTGVVGSKRLDTLVIANPRRDFPWFRKRDLDATKTVVGSREFGRIIDIALQLSSEGREGKAIGAAFVLGEPEELHPHLSQLILNPFEGHSRKLRNIHSEEFLESLREFSALDGAFVVNMRGVVESAGTYIYAPAKKVKLSPGLGARHTAAASITAQTNSVAVVISESSGCVTVFHDGQAILELGKPKPIPRRRSSANP